jgi:predicted Abi (CAAX) family protease
MLSLIQRRLHSLSAAMTTIPNRQTWQRCGVLFGVSSTIALATGIQSRLIQLEPLDAPCSTMLTLPVTLFVFPGITEEALFRGLLLPHPREGASKKQRGIAAIGSLVAYILWHPLQGATTSPAERAIFQDRRFLFQTGLLGTTCTGAYYLSGSLWPPVMIHWLTVLAWVFILGGGRVVHSNA